MYVIQFVNNSGDVVEQGDVVIVGVTQTANTHAFDKNIIIPEVDVAESVYDTRVCGVVHELQVHVQLVAQNELTAGAEMKKPLKAKVIKNASEGKTHNPQAFTPQEMEKIDRAKIEVGQIGHMVTLGAFAYCKADADIAPIKVGDLLTTSPTKGHAQKVIDPGKAIGAILGKALGSLKKGKGRIPVLVTLQ